MASKDRGLHQQREIAQASEEEAQAAVSHINGSSDALVVRTEELAKVVNQWIREWRADRPLGEHGTNQRPSNTHMGEMTWFNEYRNQTRAEPQPTMGAVEWLSDYLGLHTRSLWRIVKCETKHTNYTLADEILQAIERTDAIHIGEVRVIPNPIWSHEKWVRYMEERGCA